MTTTNDRAAVRVRAATPDDGEAIIALIRGLADYEKLPGPDDEAASRILAAIGDARDHRGWLIVEAGGRPVGYAMWVETFSTFRGRPKLFLEDIFVVPEARGTGAGFALFEAVAREALRRDCGAMEWLVLDWNQLGMDFYHRLGGHADSIWVPYAMGREALERVAALSADEA